MEYIMTIRTSKRGKTLLLAIFAFMFALSLSSPLLAQSFEPVPALAFTKPFGGANPLPQILNIVSTSTNFTFSATATTTTGGSWLTIANSGTNCCNTPSVITVTVSPLISLAVGTYTGQIAFTTTTHGNLTVPVTLTIAPTNSAY